MASPVKQHVTGNDSAYSVPNYTKDKIMIVLYTLAIIIPVVCYRWDECTGFISYLCK